LLSSSEAQSTLSKYVLERKVLKVLKSEYSTLCTMIGSEEVSSKNWPDLKWKIREWPSPVVKQVEPVVKQSFAPDKPILSNRFKPAVLPIIPLEHKESYSKLSSMLRSNVFPGSVERVQTASYTQSYPNPYHNQQQYRLKSARDFRRKRQDFSKRLELDLEFARIEKIWKKYNESQPKIIDWTKPRPKHEHKPPPPPPPVKIFKRPKPLPKPAPEPDPVIPEIDELDVFRANVTPEWAKGGDSIPEELEEGIEDDDQFWAFYDNPF